MSYEQFNELMRTKWTLLKLLHTEEGESAAKLVRTVKTLQDKLHACPNYDNYMNRMVLTETEVG